MPVFVIRHAYAGERAAWTGADPERPLDDLGWEQAGEIARVVAEQPVTRLVSSPAVRCVETLGPLADKVGLSIEVDERLAEGSDGAGVLALLAEVPELTVLCVHGSELTTIVDECVVTGERSLGKAVIWTIERDGAGRAVAARSRPCPVLESA